MVFNYNAACGSFLGNGRNDNEDNFYFNKKHLSVPNKGLKNPIKCKGNTSEAIVFAVFDGMGGECYGEEAAKISTEVFSDEFKKLEEIAMSGKAFLYSACERANKAINELREDKQLSSIGSTVAAVYISQDEVVACNVGDSKVFRIRDRKMHQISQDHTDEKILASMGISKKPVLLQYLGVPETEMCVEPYVSKGDIRSEDVYALLSDGVTDVVGLDEMYRIICENDATEAVRQLLAEVAKKDGSDNATAIVIKLA